MKKFRVTKHLFVGHLFYLLIFYALMPLTFSARAQTAAVNGKVENRFLFILDTSAAMSASAQASQTATLDLIQSAMQGQMHDGDTFGVWTFNEKLNTSFPMQIWSEESSPAILQTVAAFFGNQRYEKKAHLEKVLPAMFSVMRSSRTLTVVLVSDGLSPITGTPFDSDINDLHKEYGRDLRTAHLPFLTVLAARNGQVFDYTVNSSIGPIRIPPTVEPEKKNAATVAKTNTVAAATVIPPAPKPAGPRRADITLVHPPTTNPVSVPTPPPVVVAPVAPPPTPEPAAQTPPPRAVIAAPNPTPVVPSSAEPKKIQPTTVEVAKPTPAPPPVVPIQIAPQPPKLVVQTPTAVQAPKIEASPVSVPTPSQKPAVAQTAVTPAPPEKTTPREAQPEVASVPKNQITESKEPKVASRPAAPTVAVASPSLHMGAWILFSVTVVLLTIAIILLIFILRRSRTVPQSSLISQSLDRTK